MIDDNTFEELLKRSSVPFGNTPLLRSRLRKLVDLAAGYGAAEVGRSVRGGIEELRAITNFGSLEDLVDRSYSS